MAEGVAEVTISKPIIEVQGVPEKNALETFDRLFYSLGYVTAPSKTRDFERPLAVRTQRAQLFKELKASPGAEEKRALLEKAKELDEITRQYLTQKEMRVVVQGAGEQMSRFVVMEPPKGKESKEKTTPIVIIPGASNDIECIGPVARALPITEGRKTMVLGYPESYMGKVTPEFVKMVDEALTYEPHAEYYKKAINKILPEGDFELWGYSNGGPIVELMLTDPSINKRVENAVVVCPASCVTQTMPEFIKGTIEELGELRKDFKNLPSYTLTTGNKRFEDKEHLDLRMRVFGSLIRRVRTGMEKLWERARVKEGGKIIVVAGKKDRMTKCYDVFNEQSEPKLREVNPQLRVLPTEGGHANVLLDPEPVIAKIRAIQES